MKTEHRLYTPAIINLDTEVAEKLVTLALECVFREYPHASLHWLQSNEDVLFSPRQLTPAFYGCFDWHSSVHNHWLLARLARFFPKANFTPSALAALALSLTPDNILGEIAYLKPRYGFECPYGLVWFLQLAAELHEWQSIEAKEWMTILQPLEVLVATQLNEWLNSLFFANRTGLHHQTAFAFSLILDWATITQNQEFTRLVEIKARQFYLKDQNYPLHIEPLGYDFLSPTLAQADLLRRLLSPHEFSNWLTQFLPQLPENGETDWLKPATANQPNDFRQSHLDGLNLSRAWMLEGMITGLPDGDPRIPSLQGAANQHRQAGLAAITGEHYAGGHWLGSFAVYLMTKRGLRHLSDT